MKPTSATANGRSRATAQAITTAATATATAITTAATAPTTTRVVSGTRRSRAARAASLVVSLIVLRRFRHRGFGRGAGRGFPTSRIVCLTEETVETPYLLGQQDRIVGISGYFVRRRPRGAASKSISPLDTLFLLRRETESNRLRYPFALHPGPFGLLSPALPENSRPYPSP